MDPIILASGSLRRQEYFRLLGLPFNIMVSRVEEGAAPGRLPEEHARDMAIQKINKIVELLHGRIPPWICAADTVISLDGRIFGKPADRDEAGAMLESLQGRTHEVFTAVALFRGKDKHIDCRSVKSTVQFAPISAQEMEWYLNTGEWQGVAGSYRIQGLGGCFVKEISGSYSAIVGLPMREFYVMLRENGYTYGG